MRIENYALIGDMHTAGVVGNNGSLDWLCLPRFDSDACFAALLGNQENGYWRIWPEGEIRRTRRSYRPGTLILETEWTTAEGTVRLVDFMPPRQDFPAVVRIVEGVRGAVSVRMELNPRLGYGRIHPWLLAHENGVRGVAGPDGLDLRCAMPLDVAPPFIRARFTVSEGERLPSVLRWYKSHEAPPEPADALELEERTEDFWRHWSDRCTYRGKYREAVLRSLITLKALSYAPTGGILAAATSSLPEKIGGERNWDYRYCWLRDATFTLFALMNAGYEEEATAWQRWLMRVVGGEPARLQIMYTAAGERHMPEFELDWLEGYEGSKPVRAGNGAAGQQQLDVYGEILDCLFQARRRGLASPHHLWELERGLLGHLETLWERPDKGIWEMRSGPRQYTHSKVMAWVALDRAVRAIEELGQHGPLVRWRKARDRIHDEICRYGYNPTLRSFTQSYGSKTLDASLLRLPLVGFLPPDDARIRGTVAAVERELGWKGFVRRYPAQPEVDDLPPGEGAFLACAFWLADALILQGRRARARRLFERLLSIRNDVGLLSEEYDPDAGRLLGNFPQVFSHVALINTALNLTTTHGPALERSRAAKHEPSRRRKRRRR